MASRGTIQQRIAEVVRYHELAHTANWETKLRCECGPEEFTCKYEHAEHVAEVITEALQLMHIAWNSDDNQRPNATELWECWMSPWIRVEVEQ